MNNRKNRLVLAAAALGTLIAAPAVVSAYGTGIRFTPEPVVLIVYDWSASMDLTAAGEIPYEDADGDGEPDFHITDPAECSTYEGQFERTRQAILTEAFAGTMQGYCPVEEERGCDPTTGICADTGPALPFEHYVSTYDYQRDDGLLQRWANEVYLGFGTFDYVEDPNADTAGGFSLGTSYTDAVGTRNIGLRNANAPTGAFIPALPSTGYPSTDGAPLSWRLQNTRNIIETIQDIRPFGGTPIAGALEDAEWYFQNNVGVTRDPYRACRPYATLLATDGWDSYSACASGIAPLTYHCPSPVGDPEDIAERLSGQAPSSDCPSCDGDGDYRLAPTYVLAMGVAFDSGDALDISASADSIAEAGGTCALWVDGVCVNRAFAGDDLGVVASLGTILNNVVGGVTSAIPPQTMRITKDIEIPNPDDPESTITVPSVGYARYSAGAQILDGSPFRVGWVHQQDYFCDLTQPDLSEPVAAESPIEYEVGLDQERRIFTQRPDLLSSCARPTCLFHDDLSDGTEIVDCGDIEGAIADPAGRNVGYGTGGRQAGGTDRGGLPPMNTEDLEEAYGPDSPFWEDYEGTLLSLEDNTLQYGGELIRVFCTPDNREVLLSPDEYEDLLVGNILPWLPGILSDDLIPGSCDSEAREYIEICKRPVDEETGGEPETILLSLDELTTYLSLTDAVVTFGECVDAVINGPANRLQLEQSLETLRDQVLISGNERDYDYEAPDNTFDSVSEACLVELDYGDEAIFDWTDPIALGYFGAESPQQVEGILRWLRGATLYELAEGGESGESLLPPRFSVDTSQPSYPYDRSGSVTMGDLVHTTIALQPPPSPLSRTT
ncbi:MAG: hypothetical protein KC561_03555, partial [Myxococcales bacterium]|nr:hypothetical protein [Myxococcales bacterium]